MWYVKDILFLALAFKTHITMHLENFQVLEELKTVTMLPEQKIKIKKYRHTHTKRKYSKWKE